MGALEQLEINITGRHPSLQHHMDEPQTQTLRPYDHILNQTHLQINNVSASRQIAFSEGVMLHYSFRDAGAGNAIFRLRDGVDASANMLDTFALITNESTQGSFQPLGKTFKAIYLEIDSGTVEGVITTCSREDYLNYAQLTHNVKDHELLRELIQQLKKD